MGPGPGKALMRAMWSRQRPRASISKQPRPKVSPLLKTSCRGAGAGAGAGTQATTVTQAGTSTAGQGGAGGAGGEGWLGGGGPAGGGGPLHSAIHVGAALGAGFWGFRVVGSQNP